MRIAQVILSNSWGSVTPDAFERGIGGREGALIRLAKEWAKLGHEVTNFVPTEKAQRFTEQIRRVYPGGFDWTAEGKLNITDETPSRMVDSGYHEYVPSKLATHMLAAFPYDAVVAWECPQVFTDEVAEKQKVRLIHMQVAHLDEDIGNATGIVALSEWAREFLTHSGSGHQNMYVRPNGVNIDMYPNGVKKSKHLTVVYSSSPDRGLWHLLNMWPKIVKEHGKKSRLFVGYGVKNYTETLRWSHSRIGEMSVEIERLMKQPGVIDVGKIGQTQLASLQQKANLWLYPADTIQATETGCITAIENMAAGNPCIMSDVDCLKDEFSSVSNIQSLPFNEDNWVNMTSYVMNNIDYKAASEKGRKFAETRAWAKIAPTWIDLFKENANEAN